MIDAVERTEEINKLIKALDLNDSVIQAMLPNIIQTCKAYSPFAALAWHPTVREMAASEEVMNADVLPLDALIDIAERLNPDYCGDELRGLPDPARAVPIETIIRQEQERAAAELSAHMPPDLAAAVEDPGEFEPFPTADQFEDEATEWLIPDIIPYRTISLIGAPGGTGKSSLVADLVAGLIRGQPCVLDWGHDYKPRKPVKVMFFSAEDDLKKITTPRLRALGCSEEDLRRLVVIGNTDKRFSTIKYDSPALFKQIDIHQPNLIIFDPLQSFLPDSVDMSRRNHMRNVLQKLMGYIGERNISILIVCHCNKSQTFTGVDKIADSKDITDFARCVFVMGYTNDKDEQGNPLRYISHEKSSYSRPRDTIIYRIDQLQTSKGKSWYLVPVDISDKKDRDYTIEARQQKTAVKRQTKTEIAEEILLDLVDTNGKEKTKVYEDLKSVALLQYGITGGISERTFETAIRNLVNAGNLNRISEGFGEEKKSILAKPLEQL